jgi:hypothetical protein
MKPACGRRSVSTAHINRDSTQMNPELTPMVAIRRIAQQDDLVAPVELIGFPRHEAQRDVRRRRRLPALLSPSRGATRDGILAAS